MASKSKRPGRKPERFSLHPMKFEDALRHALRADPEKVRTAMAGAKKARKPK